MNVRVSHIHPDAVKTAATRARYRRLSRFYDLQEYPLKTLIVHNYFTKTSHLCSMLTKPFKNDLMVEVMNMCGGIFSKAFTPIPFEKVQDGHMHINNNSVNCPACGKAVSSDFAWCSSCGISLRQQQCAYCGRLLAPGEAVCPSCGAPRK